MKAESVTDEGGERLLDITRHYSQNLAGLMLEIFALYNLSRTLHVSFDMDEVFHTVEKQMKETLGISEFSIMLLDDDNDTLSVWRANSNHHDAMKDITFEVGEGVCGAVAKTGQTIAIQDVRKDERFLFYKGAHKNVGSFFSAPLKTGNGKTFGVFNVSMESPNAFKEKDMLVFNAVASHVAQAMESSKIFTESVKRSITDELTGLYSKRYFMDILGKEFSNASRLGGFFALLLMDIGKQNLVASAGAKAMDGIIKKVAQTLKKNTRHGDVIARYDGYRIAALLPGANKDSAKIVANKFQTAVNGNVFVPGDEGGTGKLSIMFGCACFPKDGDRPDDVLGKAISALDSAWNLNGDTLRFVSA